MKNCLLTKQLIENFWFFLGIKKIFIFSHTRMKVKKTSNIYIKQIFRKMLSFKNLRFFFKKEWLKKCFLSFFQILQLKSLRVRKAKNIPKSSFTLKVVVSEHAPIYSGFLTCKRQHSKNINFRPLY